MQHSLAAIRGGRPATRFSARPQVVGRTPCLGVPRRTFAPVAASPARTARAPREALRQATRSCCGNGPQSSQPPPSARQRLARPAPTIRWSRQVEGSLRQVRSRSAAPWRG